jgi:hypothetical protein
MMHRALQGASRQRWTVRGTAVKNGVRSEMMARISFPKYGTTRVIFRGKDESFIRASFFRRFFQYCWKPSLSQERQAPSEGRAGADSSDNNGL